MTPLRQPQAVVSPPSAFILLPPLDPSLTPAPQPTLVTHTSTDDSNLASLRVEKRVWGKLDVPFFAGELMPWAKPDSSIKQNVGFRHQVGSYPSSKVTEDAKIETLTRTSPSCPPDPSRTNSSIISPCALPLLLPQAPTVTNCQPLLLAPLPPAHGEYIFMSMEVNEL